MKLLLVLLCLLSISTLYSQDGTIDEPFRVYELTDNRSEGAAHTEFRLSSDEDYEASLQMCFMITGMMWMFWDGFDVDQLTAFIPQITKNKQKKLITTIGVYKVEYYHVDNVHRLRVTAP
jgi:hypothetical protein